MSQVKEQIGYVDKSFKEISNIEQGIMKSEVIDPKNGLIGHLGI